MEQLEEAGRQRNFLKSRFEVFHGKIRAKACAVSADRERNLICRLNERKLGPVVGKQVARLLARIDDPTGSMREACGSSTATRPTT